jgi:hypothetical protein
MMLYGLNDSLNDYNNCPNVNIEPLNSNNLNNKNNIVEGFLGMGDNSENELEDNPATKAIAWFKGGQFRTLIIVSIVINLIAGLILFGCAIGSIGIITVPFTGTVALITVVLSLIVNFIIFVVGMFQLSGAVGLT